jgi:hypothetical protein
MYIHIDFYAVRQWTLAVIILTSGIFMFLQSDHFEQAYERVAVMFEPNFIDGLQIGNNFYQASEHFAF